MSHLVQSIQAFLSHIDRSVEFVVERNWIEFFMLLFATLLPNRNTIWDTFIFCIIATVAVVLVKRATHACHDMIHQRDIPGANNPSEPGNWFMKNYMVDLTPTPAVYM